MKTIKEYKITIKEDSDINEILKQINFIKQQVKNKKKYEMQDLSKINILTKQPRIRSKTRTVLVPTRKEDWTYEIRKLSRQQVSMKKVNQARMEVYMEMLIKNAFRHPWMSYLTLKKITNKQFMEELNCNKTDIEILSKKHASMEEILERIGLWKGEVLEMLKDDLQSKKGKRDRLLEIVINMWKNIEDANKSTQTTENQKVIDMMKDVIDGKYTIKQPVTVGSKEDKRQIEEKEEKNTDVQHDDAIPLEDLINITQSEWLEKTE